MNIDLFEADSPGALAPIHGHDPQLGEWEHVAFVPDPLGNEMPELSAQTALRVMNARAAIAALDATARHLPNPRLFRIPALKREAQSTSELEGTYAPLADVLTADDEAPGSPAMQEVLNYVRMANSGFSRIAEGYQVTTSMLCELHATLMSDTALEDVSGNLRERQVVIGLREDANRNGFPVHAARFVPPPPGIQLETGVRDMVDWMRVDHSSRIDPVVATAMAHYQFETLHPFNDGNGRLGRYLIVLQLQAVGLLDEPTLTVSPWFEARRQEYYDALFGVSVRGDWDTFIGFFADGLRSAAEQTAAQMLALVNVQAELKELVRASKLRADSAHALVDLAIANPSFSVGTVEVELGLSYTRANKLVGQLVEIGVLDVVDPKAYKRRYFAPRVLAVISA